MYYDPKTWESVAPRQFPNSILKGLRVLWIDWLTDDATTTCRHFNLPSRILKREP